MCAAIGVSLARGADRRIVVPASIRRSAGMELPAAMHRGRPALAELKAIASKNQVLKSFIGQGY